jgi:ParB-like chromosome segregation protein Spo0J
VNLSTRTLEIGDIRTDGGTKIRELSEEWVTELMALYEEGHAIDPVLVVIDPEGAAWLADGFHRLEAQRRLGWSGIAAETRTGPLDMAKMYAAAANHHGLQRTPGEKKAAILLALSTAEGKKMGVRELARHCGVSHTYVQNVIAGGVATSCHTCTSTTTPLPETHRKGDAVLWARVDAELRADPNRTTKDIAAKVGCHYRVVAKRREVLGLPFTKADAARARPRPAVDKAKAILVEHPDWTNRRIAGESGTTTKTVTELRTRIGIAPSDKRGARSPVTEIVITTPPKSRPKAERPEPTPSAPPRKGGDVRDGADVIQFRPRPGPDMLVTEGIRLGERMNHTQREAMLAAWQTRWPEAFGGEALEGSK